MMQQKSVYSIGQIIRNLKLTQTWSLKLHQCSQNLRTNEAEYQQKMKNSQPQLKFTGS